MRRRVVVAVLTVLLLAPCLAEEAPPRHHSMAVLSSVPTQEQVVALTIDLGESATRATAREMGTATLRRFRHRQYVFARMLEDVVRKAARRAGQRDVEVEVILDEVVGPLEEAAEATGGGS